MPGPVSSVDSSVNGNACVERSLEKDRMLAPGVEPTVEGNFLCLGGCESDKDSSRFDNELAQSIEEKIIGAQARVGEASYLDGANSSNLDGYDVCGADKTGVAGSDFALLSRDKPLVCEPLSCCSPWASSWVLQKAKVIQHVVGFLVKGMKGNLWHCSQPLKRDIIRRVEFQLQISLHKCFRVEKIILLYQL